MALAAVAALLTACMADLPSSVVEGTTVRVAEPLSLTSLNAASSNGDTEGNREIAALTRDSFARLVNGEVVTDESFGTVEVIDPQPTSFTVRYDLAERTWSDGIPVDAADLLLAWAAGSGATTGEFDAAAGYLGRSSALPELDEFARRIDVTYDTQVRGWQTALDVAVPAHVVGRMALGIEDPMEAKQAVIDAITTDDETALADIAKTWGSAFDLDRAGGDLPDLLTVSSGPYLVTSAGGTEQGGDVTLEVNRAYDGDTAASYERIEVVPDAGLDGFPGDVDVLQVRPTPDNFLTVRDLRRRDNHVSETHTGELWTLALRADDGVFASRAARRAFLRATTPADVRAAGAGPWDDAYFSSQSLLFAPESDGYEIALEDAGFRQAFEANVTDAPLERSDAGVPAGTEVCVLYDSDDTFAAGAFQGLRQSVAEAGWAVSDCGEPDITSSLARGKGWQAFLTTVDLPATPSDVTAVWGGTSPSPFTGLLSRPRTKAVATLDETADTYDARDLLVAMEARLVREAVALPLALDPVITLSTRDMNAVLPDSGRSATLFGSVGDWEPAT